MKHVFVFILAVTALSLNACNQAAKPDTGAAPSTHAPSAHAAAHVEPGSHDDWCGEHQVPESMCTRCNPSLSAAFKATGDWCPEHGLPESQCLICNPKLNIVRPPQKRAE